MQASSCTFKEEDEEEDITIAPQPAQLVPVRDDWFYCEEGLKFQCRTTLEFLGLRDQDVSCTLEKVSVGDSVSWAAKISLLQQFSAPHDEIHGAGSSSDQVDGGTCSQQMWKVPPQEEREKKKPGTEGEGPKRKKAKGDPFASVLVSKTGAKLTCKGASLRKIFEHIGHAFPREALVGVKKLFKKIAEAEIQVSLDADIQFGSPPEIQIELFKVSFGEWLHLKMATKMVNDSNQSAVDQSSFPIPQGSRPLLSHPPTTSVVTKSGSRSLLCFKGKIRVRMGQVVKFMDEILGLHTVADVLQRVTQTEILKLPEATLFHMNIELEVSGGQGLNVKHLTISVKGIHLFGIPLDMESGFDLGDSNPHLFLHLRKPTMLKTIGEKPDANSISLLDILHELGIFEDRNGDTQEILKKIVLRDYTLLLQLQKVKDSSAQSLLSSSFAFSLCVSIKGLSEVIDCKACLLHHMSRTCAMLEFSNLSLSRIVSVLFGTSLPSLPIDVSPERFEWLHGAKPQITDDGTEITNLVSSCTDGARHLFLREENSFLCLAVSISLTGQLFEWIGLTGEPFKADFVVADSSAYMMVALKKFELPCAGLKAGTCTLRIDVNPLSISLKTCLLFAHDLKLRASLKGLLIPPSLTASLKLDGNRETGIPLSLFIPKLKHLAVYGIRGALSISAPLTISFMFGGAIRALWDDGPKPAFEALLRVSLIAGQPTISTIYLFCKEVTLGSIVRLFTGCSYKDVETLDHAFPQVKELGLLIKLDREELTSIPSMEIKPAQNQNSLLSIIQQSTGRKGIPLLQRENMFLGFVAQMSWLGLDAKILFCSLANTIDFTSPSLLLKLQLLIQEWTCKVGSTVLFILGGSNKELSVDLTVNTGTREVAFLFDAKVSILPKSLGLTIGTKIGFERRQGQGPSLNVAVRLSLSREDPQSEDNAIEVTRAEEQNNKIELSGSLKVTWTKIVPNIRAELGIRNLNAAMVVSAIVGGLRYCIGKIFKVCKKALQRAQRRVSKWAPGFVKWLIVGAIQMASFVADAVGGEFLDSLLTRLKTLCEGVLVVNNLQVMGEVTSDDKSVVVMVKIDISLFGHELQGSMNVNLKTLIIDICKKLLQFVLKWKKNGNKPDDVDSDNSIFFAEENEQPLIKCSTKDGSTNMLDTLVPSAFTLPDQEMKDPAREEIRSLVNDVSRKFDLRHTISPEEAFALTTTDLSDPWLSDVPCIKNLPVACPVCKTDVPPFIFSRHVKLCALRTTVECTQCNEQVRVVDQERHMAEVCPKREETLTFCEYCRTEIKPSMRFKHYNTDCEGHWKCPNCLCPIQRKDQREHLTRCPSGKPEDICEKCKCFKGNPHVCSAERFCLICRNTFDTCTNHFCDPLEKCKHCASLIPTEVMANHLDSDCTAVPITCADCNCTLPPTPRSAREKKSEHVAQCTNPRVMCHNCLQLFQLDTMSDHKLKCEQRFKICKAKDCCLKLENDVYNSVENDNSCPYCSASCCGPRVLRDHLQRLCLNFVLHCPFCHMKFLRHEIAAHLSVCTQFHVSCTLCGANGFTLGTLHEHFLKSASCSIPLPCPHCMDPVCFFTTNGSTANISLGFHMRKCAKAFRKCVFCQKHIILKHQLKHLQFECKGFNVSCFLCREALVMRELPGHLRQCPAVKVSCIFPACTANQMTLAELETHLNQQCNSFYVSCQMCNQQVVKKDEKQHWKEHITIRPTNNPPDCSLASTTFGNNLQNLIPMERKHLVGMGKLRKLAIIKLISEELTQHEEGVNMAQCQFCYESMPAHLLDDHLKFECPKYVQPCPQQCGYTGVMRYMFEHITGQCYLSKGLCIYNPGCTQPVHFRVSYDEARLLYPNQPSIEMYNTGVYHTVKNLYTSAKDRTDCGESYAEGALYTALCSKMKEEKKAFHLQKRDETRHAIFCPERELCIFCRDHVRDLSRHIPYCPFRRIPIPCIYCSDGIRIDEMVRHWLYECRGEHFFIECPNCNIRLPYRDLDIHLLSGCARSIIVCPYCKQQLPVTEYSSHLLMKCDRSCVSVTCGFCSKLCTSKELLQGSHYATQCRLCSWSCPLGAAEEREILATSASIPKSASFCCKKVPICGLEEHLIPDAGKAICISYKVSCRYKLCPVKFLRRDLTHHMEHACEENKVTCEFCGIWNGPKKRYTEHTKECPKRMSTCKRCQKEISLPEEENHLANECGQSGKDCKCGQKVPLSSWNHHRLYTCQKRTVTAHSSLLYHHALKAVPHQMVLGPHITTNEHWGKKKRDAENTALAAFTLGISTIFTSPFIYTCCGLNVKSPICTSCPLCHGPCAKGRCPRAPGQCSRCGKTLTMEQARSEVCMETCAVCNVPQSEWESTRCTPGICSICRQPPKVGEGCHDAPLDQVPWKVREMGYYKNKLNT